MKKFGGLVCSACGEQLDFSCSFVGMSENAVLYDKRSNPNWDWEVSLTCNNCGRSYPICRTKDRYDVSEITQP